MRSINDFIIDYPNMLRDKLKHGTLELIDNDINHWNKYILHGEVVSLPVSGVLPEIRIGDRIYFKYQVPEYSPPIGDMLVVPNGEVFCYVRGGVIHVCNDYSLCLPHYDEDTEEVEVMGKPMRVKTHNGLVTTTDIKHDKRITKAVYVPESAEFKKGDLVVMTSYSDQEYEVEGKTYFVIPLEEIVGKIT